MCQWLAVSRGQSLPWPAHGMRPHVAGYVHSGGCSSTLPICSVPVGCTKMQLLVTAAPCRPICQAEALPDTLPEQLVWCGSDAVLLFWEVSARLVGGHPVGWSPCPLAAQQSACGAARQGCAVQCCRLAYRSADIHSAIALAFRLQSVGGLLVTLDGAWRWWDLGAGAAAAFATEVDGGCAVTAGWLAVLLIMACNCGSWVQQAVSTGPPRLIVTSCLR